ncbi:MAG: murein peptide amidase, partial [Solirubrobacteraceae bacterium]|nr:murein peptide amidase [Solirubrobacteraceae bacterium]
REETAAALCACVAGAQLFVAAFLAPTMFGFWFPGRHLVPALPLLVPLVALGLRKLPRLGALLGAIGIGASVWLWIAVRWDGAGLAADRPPAPWGPLDDAFPLFGAGTLPYVIAGLIGAALAAAFFVPDRVWRRLMHRARAGAAASLLAALVLAPALAFAPARADAARETVGHSAEGRAITASRLGDPDSPRKALVVGNIHGNEPGGLAVTRELRKRWGTRLHGVDLWVVDSFNPDGLRHRTRQNAHAVDLNRNFPYRWRQNGRRGSPYWGGPKPLSEPESRAISRLVLRLRPAVTIWYHQPWNAVLACGRGADLQRRYARLAAMVISCRGQNLTGTATSWQNNVVGGGTAFVVEFAGGSVTEATARRHARAAALVAAG